MRTRVNGGLIGSYQPPGQTVSSTVRSMDEISRLNSGGQWPGSPYAATNVAPVIRTIVNTDAFYANIDDTALLSTGGYVRIFGSGFTSNATVYLNGNVVLSNTIVNGNEIRALFPGYSAGSTATVMVFNGAAGAIYLSGVSYSNAPSWVTATGSVGSVTETTAVNNTLQATGDGTINYYIDSGNLPAGVTLNQLTGVLSGTAPADTGSTTYNFVVRATDAQLQDSYRSFSLTINTDSFVWTTPATDGTTYSLTQSSAMSSVTLSATAASGSAVTFSANALPDGLSLAGGVISGTPTVAGSNVSLITATATTTTRTGTRLINWTINISADQYWKYAALLLTANSSVQANSFITDSSINNSQIIVAGDARAQNFNPYAEGYYSVFFPATGSYITGTTTFNTTNQIRAWTVETWIFPLTAGSFFAIGNGGSFGNGLYMQWGTTANKFVVGQGNGSSNPVAITSSGTYYAGQWYHVALTNDTSGIRRLFINGLLDGTVTYTAAALSSATTFVVNGVYDNVGLGNGGASSYISNLRLVPDQTLYNANFIPATSSLTSVSGTNLLLCNSNRHIDNSPNNFTLTLAGSSAISMHNPFGNIAPTSVTVPDTTNYSVYFDGTGDYLTVPSNAALIIGTNSATVEFWIYPTSVAGFRRIVTTTNGAFNPGSFVIRFNNGTFLAGTGGNNINSATLPTVNQWNHVAWVGAAGSTQALYINGTNAGTSTTYNITEAIQYIGGYYTVGPAEYTIGYVSSLRVTNGAALYTANFTPSTSPLTTTSQGATAGQVALLTCQNSTLIDNSTNAFAVTAVADARPYRNGPFVATTTQALIGTEGSAYFDGSGDYVQVPTSMANSFGTGDFTIECWYYPVTLPAAPACIIQNNVAWAANAWNINDRHGSHPNVISYWFYNNSTTTGLLVGTSTITNNRWYHIAVTRSGTTFRLFVNGVMEASATSSASVDGGVTQPVYIGWGGGSTYVNGYVSNARIVKGTAVYTSAFFPSYAPLTNVTNTQLLTLQNRGAHNSSTFVDNTVGNVVTRSGNASSGTFTPYGNNWSAYFNASTDFLTAGAAFPSSTATTFTIEAWIYMTSAPVSGGNISGLVGDMNSGGTLNYISFGPLAARTLSLYWYTGTGTFCNGSTVMNLGQWYHIAISVNAGVIKMFIDGVSDTLSGTTTLTNRSGTTSGITVGSYTTSYFLGYVSNLRIVNGYSLYNANFTPQTSPLNPVTGTNFLIARSNRLVDNSPTAYSLTKGGNTTVSRFSPFSSYTVTPYYSTAFNGSSDYLSIATNAALDFSTGSFTVEAWVYPTSLATDWFIISATGSGGLFVGYATGFGFGWGRTAVAWDYRPGTLTTNTWQHVAVTRNGTSMYVFVNGTQAGTTQTLATAYNLGTTSTTVGSQGANYYLNGYISNLRVTKGVALYTGAFTPATAPLAVTQSAGTGIAALTAIPTNGNSVYFNGTTDYLTAGSSSNLALGAGNWTVELWMYPTTVAVAQNIILDWRSSNNNQPVLYLVNAQPTWRVNAASQIAAGTVTANVWTHLALVKNSGTTTLYLNGVSVGSFTDGVTYINDSLQIGKAWDANYWNGYLSNVRIVKGVAVYTGAFTVPTSPLTTTSQGAVAANVSLLTCQPPQTTVIADNSPANNPITVSGSARASRTQSPFGYSPSILACQNNTLSDSGLDTLTITAATTTVKPVLLSPFTPPVSDRSLVYSPTVFGNSMYFDGTGDSLTSPGSTAFTFGADNFTVEYWVYHTAVAATYNQHVGAATTAAGFGFGNNGTALKMYMTTSTTGYTSTGTSFLLNHWHHVAYCRVSGTVTFYLDGVVNYSVSAATTITETNYGIGNTPSGTAYPMTGYLSNIRVFKGVALYTSNFVPGTSPLQPTHTIGTNTYTASLLINGTAGSVVDSTRNSNLETVGDAKVTPFSPYNGSYYSNLFTSATTYLQSATSANLNAGAGNFTVECWIYPTNVGYQYNSIFGVGTYLTGFMFRQTYNQFEAYITGTQVIGLTATTVSNGAWYHLALVRNGTAVTIYLNGVSIGTGTSSASISPTSAAIIGASAHATTEVYQGYISNLRYIVGTALYTGAFTPPTAPLTAVTNTQLLTCQSNKFIDNSANAFAITATGTPKVQTQNPFRVNTGLSYYFDGTGDYLTMAENTGLWYFGSGDFTIECWIYLGATNASTGYIVARSQHGVGSDWYFGLTSTNQLQFYALTGGAGNIATSTGTLVLNVWTHVAVARSGTNVRLFINGVVDGTLTSYAGVLTTAYGPTVVSNASNNTGSHYVTGYIADLRVTKGYARYTATFTPPIAPLSAN